MKGKRYFLFLGMLIVIFCVGCNKDHTTEEETKDVSENSVKDPSETPKDSDKLEQETIFTASLPELKVQYDADFILYYVSCGSMELASKDETDLLPLGFFQSSVDQEFSKDTTGISWGYIKKDWMTAEYDSQEEDAVSRWAVKEDAEFEPTDGVEYQFEVPKGTYEVTTGFVNPFSYRTVTVEAEGQILSEEVKLYKFKTIEDINTIEVTDGILNLKVSNPNRGNDAMKNPILSYIIVRIVPEYNKELLECQLNSLTMQQDLYTLGTWKTYESEKEEVQKLYQSLTDNQTKVSEEEIKEAYSKLKNAVAKLEKKPSYDSFQPGKVWKDTDGNLIQAHGGQVQKLTYQDKDTKETVTKWWWVGEDKSKGYRGGIRAYSSDDLYHWQFEGVVMRNVSDRALLDTDSYFTELYKGYTKEQLDNVYRCINDSTSVIERPKMIYNEKTKQYVMWFHADGPTQTSDANYAAASAGVAVSDSPYGPFRFIDRYRLNTCPSDQQDMYPESKGMARDMNLFVDDDNTAYIIYSSEENLTMYISKLNEDYTYLAVSPEQAVHGKDFIRLFPGAQREAPALFKRNGMYYMMTSGATGWNPNQARYYMADSIFGTWEDCGDPCIEDINHTTFDSQSTCIFAANEDTYIYMGDRWNSEDLANSRYIWLPVQFTQEGKIELFWEEEWKIDNNGQDVSKEE